MSVPTTEMKVASLEARVKALESNAMSWLKTNWAHFVTWAGVAYTALKHL